MILPKFNGSIFVTVENSAEKSDHIFDEENLNFSRAGELFIMNDGDKESNFYETVKMWHGIDKNTNTTSYLTLKTEPLSVVEGFRKYYIDRINEEKQSITLKWI